MRKFLRIIQNGLFHRELNNIGVGIDIKVYGTQAQSINTITASIAINYNKATLNNIDPRTLKLYVSHDDGETWKPIDTQYHDLQNKIIYGTLTYLSLVGIAGETFPSTLGKAFAYPNPYIPSKGHTKVYFANLTPDAIVKIYDISGALIKELTRDEAVNGWDPRKDGIASGVYIYVIKDSKERKIGKLAIIR